MEKFVFIHGSASGQSSLPLNAISSRICGEVGKWYFEGRESRILGVPSTCSMVVELFTGSNGKHYCMYSYVHNECYGPAPDLRPGQYFAVTIALQEYYCMHPSSVFSILSGAYSQLIRNKIIAENANNNGKEYKGVYQIGQFKEREAYLVDFMNKISSFFERDCSAFCKELPKSANLPLPWNGKPITKVINNRVERIPWNGDSVHPVECDSQVIMEKLWKDGRLYISDETPLANDRINQLLIENQKLEQRAKALQEKIDNPVVDAKTKQEIAALKAEIERRKKEADQLMSTNSKLEQDNKNLLDTYDGLAQVLNKYKSITSRQLSSLNMNAASEVSETKSWRRWIKAVALSLILVFSLISLLFNIHFFRSLSPDNGEREKKVELTDSIAPGDTTLQVQGVSEPEDYTPAGHAPDYGLKVTDESGRLISSVYPGQKIRAKVSKAEKNLSFTAHGVTESSVSNDAAEFTVTTDPGINKVTISYGVPGENNQNKQQKIIIKINRS